MIGYDVGILALALGASRLADEGFISVGMRNAADATTLLQSLKPAVPVAAAAQSSDGGGCNSRGGSQSGKVRRRRSETAKFGLEAAAGAATLSKSSSVAVGVGAL